MKQKSSLAPLVLSFLSFFLIGVGSASIFLFQSPLQEGQFDTRNSAAIDAGMVILTTSPASGSTFTSTQSATVNIQANTQGVLVDGIQLTFKVTTTASEIVVNPVANSGVQVNNVEVEKVSDGYLVSFATIPVSPNTSFSSTSATNIVQLVLNKLAGGITQITFDNTNSKSLVHNSNPIRDELRTLPVFHFVIANAASPTPSPKQCNQSCTSNVECGNNFRCYQNQCRLAVNPTSSSCSAAPDQGLQRTCNQYCADTKECADGFTCFSNRCRKPENPDSATCGQVTGTTSQAMNKSCNTTCASNKECAVNLRCYNGTCRLATNPSSTTCSATNQTTVSGYFGKGEKGADDGSGSISSTPSAKPSTAPTGSSAYIPPAATGTVLSKVSELFQNVQTSIEGVGIPLPTLAISAGIALLVLAILATILGRKNKQPAMNRMPSPVKPVPPAPVAAGSTGNTLRPAFATPAASSQSTTTTPADTYESTLQSRIAELRAENAATKPSPLQSSQVQPAPAQPSQPPVEKAADNPMTPPPSTLQAAPTNQSTTQSSSMMEKLKQRQTKLP
jgi:hypothetical protein